MASVWILSYTTLHVVDVDIEDEVQVHSIFLSVPKLLEGSLGNSHWGAVRHLVALPGR